MTLNERKLKILELDAYTICVPVMDGFDAYVSIEVPEDISYKGEDCYSKDCENLDIWLDEVYLQTLRDYGYTTAIENMKRDILNESIVKVINS